MILPTIAYFIVLGYLPMRGFYYAFSKFKFGTPLFENDFVGLKNFEYLFSSGTLAYLTRNTFLYNIAFIVLGNLTQMAVAIMLSNLRMSAKRSMQTMIFFPYFISFVIVKAFSYAVLNSTNGMLTVYLRNMGVMGFDAYTTAEIWPFIIVLVYLWKQLGYGSVIYLAAITSIDDTYYEAASIDGATAWQKVTKITIPMLKPTIITLTLMAVGVMFRGQFQLFYNLVGDNGLLFESTDILDTYIFRTLKSTFNISIGTATCVYQSLFGFAFIMLVNGIVRKVNPDNALF
ncbi:MAG TPA: sugar ABC transporter permease [Candidatus Limiplasma pullicola]|nr:sugar ABC transporter permease [Candidatus Limiplasma pullicola]